MPRPECPPEENVLRAIHSAHWDERKERYSSSLFKGSGTSVSRLSILSMVELFAIFHEELDSPTSNQVVKSGGEINVGRLQQVGRGYQPRPTDLTVEEAPTETNHAHAEIPQNISKGLAFEIIRALTIHTDPTSPQITALDF